MKRQITQFDNGRTNATVATPTCSSCCCCCCCLTTTLASSTLLARRINKEAREKHVADPIGLTLLAALFLPVIGFIVFVLYRLINSAAGSCTSHISEFDNYAYQVCTKPANAMLPFLLFVVPVAVLAYLYARVRMGLPLIRAIVVTIIIWIATWVEAFAGAAMILTGVGGIVYLILVPFLVGAIIAFYEKKILHGASTRLPAAAAAPSAPKPPVEPPHGVGTGVPVPPMPPTETSESDKKSDQA